MHVQEEASELVLVDESAWSGCVPPPSDLGYEQVETGPTSNFVGNHMTQAAVDVVQYQLGKRDLEYERKKHMKYQQTYHPPKRIPATNAKEAAGEKTRTTMRAVQRYTWEDHGESVLVRIMPEERDSVHTPCVDVTDDGDEAHISFTSGDETHVLVLRRLFGSVNGDKSSVRIDARGAILASLYKRGEGIEWSRLMKAYDGNSLAARKIVRDAEEDPRSPRVGGRHDLLPEVADSGTMVATAAKVEKRDVVAARRGPTDADLAKLRRALIQQRESKKAGDGFLFPNGELPSM